MHRRSVVEVSVSLLGRSLQGLGGLVETLAGFDSVCGDLSFRDGFEKVVSCV